MAAFILLCFVGAALLMFGVGAVFSDWWAGKNADSAHLDGT